MTRLYIIAALLLCVIALIAMVAWQSRIVTDLRQERDAANETINSTEDFNDAASNPDNCAWLDRLRGSCPD